MKNTSFKFDPTATPWEFGYWTKGWNEPDYGEHQHWEGSSVETWSINRALDRAIELGFLDASDREMVRLACLNDGEYFFGSDETSGWMIGVNDLFNGFRVYPNEPIWMIVKLTFETEVFCPILDRYEFWELKEENRIIKSKLTLPETLNIVLPSGEENPKYLDVSLQCLYAVSGEDSYTCLLEQNQWVQICRKDIDNDNFDEDNLDEKDFEEEMPYG
ncbi:MAG: hypothetical protein WBA41_00245 [Rivularia sp. (in: cyanobacteria)]